METAQIEIEKDTFLRSAQEIGMHLAKTAIWDATNTYCSWLGARDIHDAQIAKYSKRISALSPEFYSGTGGVACFLIELFDQTGNPAIKKTALGAWLRSVNYMKINEFPASSISYYAGELGLIHVGYRFIEVAKDLETEIRPHLNALISTLENGLNVDHSLDLIGGNSGAIPVLIQLHKKYQLEIFKTMALACADELVENGSWQGDICIWASPKVHGVELDTPPTTGYSHGASGIGVALLEAYAYTNNEKYLKFGRGAFAFENALFNSDEGNWIDTRYPHVKRNGKITGTFRGAWCHGAPGIALANLRASALDIERKDFHLEMAAIAIDTTKKSLYDKLTTQPLKDATLCHGILGLSDILYSYGTKMEKEEWVKFAQETSLDYINKFDQIIDLPSGIVSGGYSPSIMVGHAGIGLHCLRLHTNQIINSPLIIVI